MSELKGFEDFEEFSRKLREVNRFFIEDTYTEVFDDIREQHTGVLEPNSILFRGRRHKYKGKYSDPTPYTPEELGMPKSKDLINHNRANPCGIRYMYLANSPNVVISELRPNIKDFVSVGTFNITTEKKILELERDSSTARSGTKFSSNYLSLFMLGITHSFSRPIDTNYKELEYLPSQVFSEYCKSKGLDGIRYPSSVSIGEKDFNYVLFSDEGIICESVQVYQIHEIEYKFYKITK